MVTGCAVCGAPVIVGRSGWPSVYCGPRCRRRAKNRRRALRRQMRRTA